MTFPNKDYSTINFALYISIKVIIPLIKGTSEYQLTNMPQLLTHK